MKQTTPVVKHLRIIQEVDSEIDESDIALINEDVSDSETVYVGEPDRKDESDADTVIIEDDDSKTPANPPPTLTPRAPLRRVSRRRLPFTKLWKNASSDNEEEDSTLPQVLVYPPPPFRVMNGVEVSTRDSPESPDLLSTDREHLSPSISALRMSSDESDVIVVSDDE